MKPISHSRQRSLLGAFSDEQLQKASVFFVGITPTTAETVKNLVLCGIGSIVLADLMSTTADGVSFAFAPGKTASVSLIEAVSPLCKSGQEIKALEADNIISQVSLSTVVVVSSEISSKIALDVNEECRKKKKPFLLSATYGVTAALFLDFNEYTHFKFGKPEDKIGIIDSLERKKNPAFTLKNPRNPFRHGDHVLFFPKESASGIEAVVLRVSASHPKKSQSAVKESQPICYILEGLDTTDIIDEGAFITYVPQASQTNFVSLRESLKKPTIVESSVTPKGISVLVFLACISRFMSAKGRLPKACDEDLIACAKEVREISAQWEVEVPEEEDFIQMMFQCSASVECVNSIMGGIIAQEILKGILQIYYPINQWFVFEAFDVLRPIDGDRAECYAVDQHALWGEEVKQQLQNANIFLVGAGALGCEFLKNFAMLGVCTGEKGKLTVTDPDEISHSNLHRQFLFSEKDIGKPKSTTAVQKVLSFNKKLKVKVFTTEVTPSTAHIFHDDFWESLDVVVAGVDSVAARLFLNDECHNRRVPFLESGTSGLSCNTNTIIPYVTAPYQAPPIDEIELEASCTGKQFPFKVEHLVAKAKIYFEDAFTVQAQATSFYGEFTKGKESANSVASKLFQKYFIQFPSEIVSEHPRGCTDENTGEPYWTGFRIYPSILSEDDSVVAIADFKASVQNLLEKRAETTVDGFLKPIPFEKDDSLVCDFIYSCSVLLARMYNLPAPTREFAHRVAGEIIPAIVTTTAVAAGLVCLELVKVLSNKTRDLSRLRNNRVTLDYLQLYRSKPRGLPKSSIASLWITSKEAPTIPRLVRLIEKKFFSKVVEICFWEGKGDVSGLTCKVIECPATHTPFPLSKLPDGVRRLRLQVMVQEEDPFRVEYQLV